MKVFIDTNVKLAGRFEYGLCALLKLGGVQSPEVLSPSEVYTRLRGLV